ncbi:thiamine-phosphate kinase [Tengunoibacter tsumagoiensis]|uniref:Thiamine-monophosphate kinase n=1 Tax=Tengunoibacter tsumagoiensis TaxID=2014871 RepID=A0A402A245_9CHLR|nr:thiamine-phosphate kinase [Tengunoibacter tsumagoiensis]GCE13194.1 thiamine-monophosphate kinase [Tengunoibacter tsumagoiensis]
MDHSSLGEFELIARLTQGLHSRADVALGVGDDCALLELGGDLQLLATCDSQVEGVHFTLQTARPEQIGRKALAVNISDIAAMGGVPRYALISLILPQQIAIETLEGIYRGLQQEAERYELSLVGGNIASSHGSKQLIIDITLLGTIERGRALLRSGAEVGDLLCITGQPGSSAAGLYTLFHPDQPYDATALISVQATHHTPEPRVSAGRLLSRFSPQQVTAALDVSDGLSGDLQHLCERSHVGALVEQAKLPISQHLFAIAQAARRDPFAWILHGGEDYELLFTLKPSAQQEVLKALWAETGTPVSVIGAILPESEGLRIRLLDGREEALRAQSWDHLRQS